MDSIPLGKYWFSMNSSDVLWWLFIIAPPLLLVFHALNISIVLYIIGLIASAAFGSLSWISLRSVINIVSNFKRHEFKYENRVSHDDKYFVSI